MSAITSGSPSSEERRWWSDEPDVCVARLESDATRGLTSSEAADRLGRIGPNQITAEAPPSWWSIVLVQLADPMNLMLIAVVVVSLIIRQTPVAVVVAFLVLLNVVLGSQQELKARASVDALAKMQVPRARVIRDDALVQISATELVPGDIVQLEAGTSSPPMGACSVRRRSRRRRHRSPAKARPCRRPPPPSPTTRSRWVTAATCCSRTRP
ncbi:MAG: cation-transporting P-type ATPase [Microbacteriaceae bacterium]